MNRERFYVGLKHLSRTVFKSRDTPSPTTHGHAYAAVIGPFRTKRGAIFMRDHGQNNPHCQSVADAERLAVIR